MGVRKTLAKGKPKIFISIYIFSYPLMFLRAPGLELLSLTKWGGVAHGH